MGGILSIFITAGGHEISSQDGDSEDEGMFAVITHPRPALPVVSMLIGRHTQHKWQESVPHLVSPSFPLPDFVPSLSVEFLQESSAASDSGTSLSAQQMGGYGWRQVLQYQLSQSQNEAPVQSSGPSFSSYDSPLARYPLLRSRCGPETRASDSSLVAGYLLSELAAVSQPSTGFSTPNVHSSSPISFTLRPGLSVSSHSSSPIPCPDLKPLKQAYEVPGGGVCHDNDCEELHLSRIASEPNDTEVATYVHGTLPHPWSGRCDVHAIEIALEGVRLRGGIKDVDARVWEALAGLDPTEAPRNDEEDHRETRN
ncbi:hypothetical protein BS17DRAFT_819534 [Gyrodon lividus]|nr:hypothetical protein BS17DRAFT_819534 [Gyrodon lividus]